MIGASYERGFTKHSGIETGLYHHSLKIFTEFSINGQLQYITTVRHHYMNIPVLYKYYSDMVNITAGPAINIFAGWKQIGMSKAKVTSVKQSPHLGYQIKVSKSFELDNNFVLEPEVRLINFSFGSNPSFGVGMGIKHRL